MANKEHAGRRSYQWPVQLKAVYMSKATREELICALKEAYAMASEWLPDQLAENDQQALYKEMEKIKSVIDNS
jgi:hypothetical protein